MVLEDNDDFRQTLINLLGSRFHSIKFEEATNGGEAFQKIMKSIPDVIFVDMTLPGKSGLDVMARIRKIYPEVILISMTSYDSPEYKQAAEQHGADYYMSKSSSSFSEIIEIVESVLNRA